MTYCACLLKQFWKSSRNTDFLTDLKAKLENTGSLVFVLVLTTGDNGGLYVGTGTWTL